MASLPYITEYCGFKGKIYATEATVQYGRQLLKEMSFQLSQGSLVGDYGGKQKQRSHSMDVDGNVYRKIYTEEEIEASLGKVTVCSYDERLTIVDGLKVSPHSSGYCIGACNWVIESTSGKRVVFASQQFWSPGKPSSHSDMETSNHRHAYGVKAAARNAGALEASKMGSSSIGSSLSSHPSQSSTTSKSVSSSMGQMASSSSGSEMKFHPQPLKSSVFGNADCVILTQVGLSGSSELDAYFGDMCSQIGQTLSIGGSILIPISNAGLILDLFSIIDTYLTSVGFNPSVQGGISTNQPIPIYYLSPVAHSILSYANISAEWLHPYHQEKVYAPQNPFPHSDLIQMGRLIPLHSLSGDSTPSISNPTASFNPSTAESNSTRAKGGQSRLFSSDRSTDPSQALYSESSSILSSTGHYSSQPSSNTSSSPNGIRNPSIILCGHPCLRFGDIIPLIETFKQNPKNTILFVDGKYEAQRGFAPFLSNALCRLHICPLDTRLSANSAHNLIIQHCPKRVVVSHALEPIFSSFFSNSRNGHFLPSNLNPQLVVSETIREGYCPDIISMKAYQTTKVTMERGDFQKGFLSPQLSASIIPKPLSSKSNVVEKDLPSIAVVKGQLSHRDGSFMIQPSSLPSSVALSHFQAVQGSSSDLNGSEKLSHHGMLFGSFLPTKMIEELESIGITHCEHIPSPHPSNHTSNGSSSTSNLSQLNSIGAGGDFVEIRFPQIEASICFSPTSTRIRTNRTESRKLLKQLIVSHLTK